MSPDVSGLGANGDLTMPVVTIGEACTRLIDIDRHSARLHRSAGHIVPFVRWRVPAHGLPDGCARGHGCH